MAGIGLIFLPYFVYEFFRTLADPQPDTYVFYLLAYGLLSILMSLFLAYGVIELASPGVPRKHYKRYLEHGLKEPIVIYPGLSYLTTVLAFAFFVFGAGGYLVSEGRANPDDPDAQDMILIGGALLLIGGPLCLYLAARGVAAFRSGFIRIEKSGVYMHAVGSVMRWKDLGHAFVEFDSEPKSKFWMQDSGTLYLQVRNLERYATQSWPFNAWSYPGEPNEYGLHEVRVEAVYQHAISNFQMVEIINAHAKIDRRRQQP